ncbi:MAG: hypothetical protein HOQ22_07045, partial [Nocardioidaceae bacterium]|nr:hypothetical protein [Nocardioidaceae bacterium]
MKRAAVLVAAALCAATPASIGLVGNASFSENVPVRVPERAVVLSSDGETPAADQTRLAKSSDDGDHRRRHRGSDDRGSDD